MSRLTDVQYGDGVVLDLTAPYAVDAGEGALVGTIFGVAQIELAVGVSGPFAVEGEFYLAKTSAQEWTEGAPIYWNTATKLCDNVATVGPMIGHATEAAANPSASGYVRLVGPKSTMNVTEGAPALVAINTAGAVTLTAAQILGGLIVADCAGAGRTYTLPTAALMVAAVPNAKVGDLIKCYIVNGSDAAETITLAAGAGGDFDAIQIAASRVIPQNASKHVHIRLTNVTAASEAYVVAA